MQTFQAPTISTGGNTCAFAPQWQSIQPSVMPVFFEPPPKVFPAPGNPGTARPPKEMKRRSEPPLRRESISKAKKPRMANGKKSQPARMSETPLMQIQKVAFDPLSPHGILHRAALERDPVINVQPLSNAQKNLLVEKNISLSKSKDVIETAMKYGIEFDDYWYERLRIVYNVINSSKAKDGHKRATMFKKLPTDPSLAFYYDLIGNPIDLTMIKKRIDNCSYTQLCEFTRDINTLFDNAIAFNIPESLIFEDATYLKQLAHTTIKRLFGMIDDKIMNLSACVDFSPAYPPISAENLPTQPQPVQTAAATISQSHTERSGMDEDILPPTLIEEEERSPSITSAKPITAQPQITVPRKVWHVALPGISKQNDDMIKDDEKIDAEEKIELSEGNYLPTAVDNDSDYEIIRE